MCKLSTIIYHRVLPGCQCLIFRMSLLLRLFNFTADMKISFPLHLMGYHVYKEVWKPIKIAEGDYVLQKSLGALFTALQVIWTVGDEPYRKFGR